MVFEYGSGNSTLFWPSRSKKLFSVEDDPRWHEKIKGSLPPKNVDYQLIEDKGNYIKVINILDCTFDVIIIVVSHRFECAVEALSRLSNDGFNILDNSDWRERTSELLRKADLIEVDMSGFGPINNYSWATSFYFRRNVHLVPTYNRQPIYGVGSLHNGET